MSTGLHIRVVEGAIEGEPTTLPSEWDFAGGTILNFPLVDDPESYGWYPVVDDETPAFDPLTEKLVTSYEVGEDEVARVFTVLALNGAELDESFATLKAQWLTSATAQYEEFLAEGYRHTFTVEEEEFEETLQCRNELDRTNWLALKDSCNDALLAGLGAVLCPLPIRCTSNATYQLSFSAAAQLMRDLRTWAGGLQAKLWQLKDAIAAAERDGSDFSELTSIDVTVDWP